MITYLKQHRLVVLLVFVVFFMVFITFSVLTLQTNPENQGINEIASSSPVSNTLLEENGILYGTSGKTQDLLISVVPPTTEALIPGNIQTFVFTFKDGVSPELKVTVMYHSILDNSDEEVPFTILTDQSRIAVTLAAPVRGYGEYTISVLNNNEELFNLSYVSDVPKATPAPNNNLALIEYLPFETNTFALTYLPNQNKYLFSYKLDVNSTKEAGVQYDDAKAEALQFIRNRGIDPNTLIIEWSFH